MGNGIRALSSRSEEDSFFSFEEGGEGQAWSMSFLGWREASESPLLQAPPLRPYVHPSALPPTLPIHHIQAAAPWALQRPCLAPYIPSPHDPPIHPHHAIPSGDLYPRHPYRLPIPPRLPPPTPITSPLIRTLLPPQKRAIVIKTQKNRIPKASIMSIIIIRTTTRIRKVARRKRARRVNYHIQIGRINRYAHRTLVMTRPSIKSSPPRHAIQVKGKNG
jgi:hypothetical protein